MNLVEKNLEAINRMRKAIGQSEIVIEINKNVSNVNSIKKNVIKNVLQVVDSRIKIPVEIQKPIVKKPLNDDLEKTNGD